MEDITLRALRTLRDADIIVCEDTRVTKKLLFHYEIAEKTLWAYDEHAHDAVYGKILSALESGNHIALVSDAGMPCISDPGSFLIQKLRTETSFQELFGIDSVPGATALTTALATSGVDTVHGFQFFGFAPHKKGRETLFRTMVSSAESGIVSVCYESTHRIMKCLEQIAGYSDTVQVTLCRELTKMFEQTVSGKPSELSNLLIKNPDFQRGEFVVIISQE